MSMFEKATRQKLRFQTKKGNCSVEDLWDLPLKQLDTVYRDLNAELRETQEESLLENVSASTETLRTKIEIVKYIVQIRQEEQRKKEEEVERKRKKDRIMEMMEQKEEENLKSKSMEELRQELENL